MADVIVGRFALVDLIAKGGSGSVWRAWDQKHRSLCAAKVLRQRDSADLMRFVREKGVSFDHPHLLTPYGWGAEDEHVVIAMPLVSGGTLETIVKQRGKLSEPAVVVILDQLLSGLGHVHEAGWIHRDVKPANIMFEARGRSRPHTRLADFGIAVHESDVRFTHVGMVNGTPGYMAPELFSMAEPEPSQDLYAAGVVALVALNGPLKLRDGAMRPEELDQRLRGVTPKFAAILRKLLAATPSQRYRDAAAVRRDLPRVPSNYPLTYADGRPLELPDTLPQLPPDAPGAVRRPERPADVAPHAMEAIRSGRVQQGFGAGAPSGVVSGRPGNDGARQGSSPPQNGSRPAQGNPYGPGNPQTGGPQSSGPQTGGPQTGGPQTSRPQMGSAQTGPRPGTWLQGPGTAAMGSPTGSPTTAGTGQRPAPGSGGGRRNLLIAIAIGVMAALVFGAVVAVVLLNVFAPDPSAGPDTPPETTVVAGSTVPVVEDGQECSLSELGTIGVTQDDQYLSCRGTSAGAYAYGS